ncbi:MAG: hypothetical protein ACO1OB_10200 [Archangium sp.]
MTREELVERSIRVLHRHDDEIDHRSAFNSLWKLLTKGFTHRRLLPILLERRATYRFPHDVHPAIDTVDEDLVNRDQGFKDEEFVYCDAGTELWEQFKENLSGHDVKPPEEVPMKTLATHVMRAAEKSGDVELLAAWEQLSK